MRFHVVIPARFASTRLPGKPLLEIGGKPMVQHVVERACGSGATEVLVATDDARVAQAVSDPRSPGRIIAMMTDESLPSGTDRVAAVAQARGWADDTIVVNVQGDEPFLPARLIDQVAGLLNRDVTAAIATLATPIESLHDFLDPNVVKVVTARDGAALYFSRAPIPWSRDGARHGLGSQLEFAGAMRHVGVYAYRVGALRQVTSMAPTNLEGTEKLEQLRALQSGLRISRGHLRGTARAGCGYGSRSAARTRACRSLDKRSCMTMNQPFLVAWGVTLTAWKLVGYLGVALFAGRWFVQMYYSRRYGKPVVPTAFWIMSISGSLLLLSYFTFGKNDSVGILSNLFPAGVAGYNLFLDLRNKRNKREGPATDEATGAPDPAT